MRVPEITSTLALAVGAATASGPLSSKQSPFSDKAFETLGPLMKAYMKSHRISLVVACPSCDPPALGTGHVRTYPDDYPDCVPNLATGEQGLRIDISVCEDEMELAFNNRTIFPNGGTETYQLYQVSKLAHNKLMETPVDLTGLSGTGGRVPVSVSEAGEETFIKSITIENINMLELLRGVTVDIHFLKKKDGQVRIEKVEPVERKDHKPPRFNIPSTKADLRDFGPAPPEDETCANLLRAERLICNLHAGEHKSQNPGGADEQGAARLSIISKTPATKLSSAP
ncbi:hypothetical protein KC361_g9107 [Hortaea werneckii]|nr:hypothetical protein KC361_g9107 [Hortaea werneckii]